MPAQTPEQCDELLGQYLGEGNLDACLTLYEPQASVVQQDGKSASGTAAIREFFMAFAAARPKLAANIINVVKAGDDFALGILKADPTTARASDAHADRNED